MARKVLFRAPYGVTNRDGTVYHALVNGEKIKGSFEQVDGQYKAGKNAQRKANKKTPATRNE